MNATELSRRLGQQAEAVCRRYLSNGCKEGRYWLVGNVDNAPGRSLYVRLFETERGRVGNWVDAATGEHGDLVDLIRLNQRHGRLAETIEEALGRAPERPARFEGIEQLPKRVQRLPADAEQVKAYIAAHCI